MTFIGRRMRKNDRETLFKWRDKYCRGFERGIVTASEGSQALLSLLVDAQDDGTCLPLCTELPEWLCTSFLDLLDDLETTDYYRRSFGICDTRPKDQVHADALCQQEMLRRLTPEIRNLLHCRSNSS